MWLVCDYACHIRFTRVEAEAFEDVCVQFDDLLTCEAHFFIGVDMVAAEGKGLFDGFVHDAVQRRLVGVAELLVEAPDDALWVSSSRVRLTAGARRLCLAIRQLP